MQLNPFAQDKGPSESEIVREQLDLQRDGSAYDIAVQGDEAFIAQQQARSDLIKWQQDLGEDLKQSIFDLGYTIDKNGWLTQREDMKPLMNQKGIKKFISLARPHLSKNLIMSNYTEERILRNLRNTTVDFIMDLGYHHKVYNIVEGPDMSTIVDMFKRLIEPAHFRSLGAGERNNLNKMHKMVEAYTERQGQEKKGFLNSMFGGN